MRIFVIDAGNTAIKLGLYENNELHKVQRFAYDEIDDLIDDMKTMTPDKIAISSVVSPQISQKLLDNFDGISIGPESKIPISNSYKTPNSLGIDRLCNAVAASILSKTEYAATIDIGTCIKFDVVSKNKGYIGGSISPGVDLRFKSLNDYTEKLPLLSNKTNTSLVGVDTETSIRSGVINGINAEIAGFVTQYESIFEGLTFFVTGGDATYFDIQVKNDIFADENLTLKGLFEIYRHNA